MEYTTNAKDEKNILLICTKTCILNAPDTARDNRLELVNIGQGEGETM
jgi:hypothetical protein